MKAVDRESGESSPILFKEESYAIMGASFDVYNELKSGFSESVYQEALEQELGSRRIPFQSQVELPVHYKGNRLKSSFKADLLCFQEIIVELKAARGILDEHRAQIINYLNAARKPLGLLVNFGSHPNLQSERFALTSPRSSIRADLRDSRSTLA